MVLSKFTQNSLDTNLFRGSNLRQNPAKSLFRGRILHLDLHAFRGIFQNLCSGMCIPAYLSGPPGLRPHLSMLGVVRGGEAQFRV